MSIKESVEIFKGIDQQDEHFPTTIKEFMFTLKLVVGLFLVALSLGSSARISDFLGARFNFMGQLLQLQTPEKVTSAPGNLGN